MERQGDLYTPVMPYVALPHDVAEWMGMDEAAAPLAVALSEIPSPRACKD